MTSSQPPHQPGHGQPPAGPSPYGQPQPGYGQQPPVPGHNPYGQPVGNGGQVNVDTRRLKLADYVVAGGALLWFVLSFFTWVDYGTEDVYGDDFGDLGLPEIDENFNAWNISGSLTTLALLCLLAAAVWALLPAITNVRVPFPRSYVTVALTALATIFTLIVWIDAQELEFSLIGLLALLVALATTAFAVLGLLPELKNRPGLPGGLANAAQWANQQSPAFGAGQDQQQGQQHGQPQPPQQPYGQQQPYSPPQPGQGPNPGQPSGGF